MPPCLDVYVRTSDLDRSCVERFLDAVLPAWRDLPVWLTDDVDHLEPALSGEVNNLAFYSGSRKENDAAEQVRVVVADLGAAPKRRRGEPSLSSVLAEMRAEERY